MLRQLDLGAQGVPSRQPPEVGTLVCPYVVGREIQRTSESPQRASPRRTHARASDTMVSTETFVQVLRFIVRL
jgi:hypothetical protein